MSRGFQIWSQNSNLIISDRLFGPKTVENWLASWVVCQFSTVFWPKGERIKYYSIWILRTDLESSHHLASVRTPYIIIITFWILDTHVIIRRKMGAVAPFFCENVNVNELIIISVKKASDRGWDRAFPKSCTIRTTPMYSPSLPPLLTYRPKQENLKGDAAELDMDRFC